MTCSICAKHDCLDECLPIIMPHIKNVEPESMHDKLAHRDDLIYRLEERARIRRQIPGRKSVQEGKPDRMSDLLEEAAKFIRENT